MGKRLGEESVKRRYASKLIGNIGSGALTFFQQTILARTLGPSAFGVFTFIQVHLENIFATSDLGFSQALFTQLSQDRTRYAKLVSTYLTILLGALFLALSYVLVVSAFPISHLFWPEVPPSLMVLGVWLAFNVFVSKKVIYLTDAAGLAQRTETLRIYRAVVMTAVFSAMAYSQRLTLPSVIFLMGLSYFIFSTICAFYGHQALSHGTRVSLGFDRATWKEMWKFGKPLAIYVLVVYPLPTLERWLLQYIGGSVQQGYHGLATQLSLPVFLVAASIFPIYLRENAVAYGQGNWDRIRSLHANLFRRVVALAVVLSVFLAINAKTLISLAGGADYQKAFVPVSLLLLYPIVQTVSELSLSLLLATHRTRTYMRVGIFREVVASIVGYFLMAPKDWVVPGLALGATGLAIKQIFGQGINAALILVFNCRVMGVSTREQFTKDAALFSAIGIVGLVAQQVSQALLGNSLASVFQLVASAAVFFPLVLAIVFTAPSLFGLPPVKLWRASFNVF